MAGPVPAFRLSWSRLFKAAFREGEDTLPVQELRERVIQAARAAAEEAGADVPDRSVCSPPMCCCFCVRIRPWLTPY